MDKIALLPFGSKFSTFSCHSGGGVSIRRPSFSYGVGS